MLHNVLPLLKHIQLDQMAELVIESSMRGTKHLDFFCCCFVLIFNNGCQNFPPVIPGVPVNEEDVQVAFFEEDDRVYWYVL